MRLATGTPSLEMLRERFLEGQHLDTVNVPRTVLNSWSRSHRYGLASSDKVIFNAVSRAEKKQIEEKHRDLIERTQTDMSSLFRAIGDKDWIIACLNTQGVVVNSLGAQRASTRALEAAFRVGVNLAENVAGTTGPACVLVDHKPVIVQGAEHYLREAQGFTCVSVPIFKPDGQLYGVLDASCNIGGSPVLVRDSLMIAARATENRLVTDMEHAILMHFHFRADVLGTPFEGILALNEAGDIIGSNQTARQILGQEPSLPAGWHMESAFEISFTQLRDSVIATRQTAPITLRTQQSVSIQARFDSGLLAKRSDAPRTTPTASLSSAKLVRPAAQANAPVFTDLSALLNRAQRAFARDVPILINGETGTGKEVFAQQLHAQGPRRSGNFVAINCSAIPATLIEAELFGYEDGAFTGSRRGGAKGRLEEANGGTLFLDEIGDMPLELQSRLLRVLQERSLTRLAGNRSIPLDLSLICATHRDLAAMVTTQTFREDLFYRINGLQVGLPALRERKDLPELIEHLLAQATAGYAPLSLSEHVQHSLLTYHWPGNIRQLQNVLRLAAIMAEDERVIELPHLPDDLQKALNEQALNAAELQNTNPTQPTMKNTDALPQQSLQTTEQQVILAALEFHRGNLSATAKSLGIARATLYRKLKMNKSNDH
ncbi:sigma-54-dependent Fis family transcriptional regulator [Ampullimonas aquatilis]|uniref:sigma-54-dependent Fis family transcriptional regulator n=1 Tax=Ampullimonas aquatilis TaxID=1341549 RepID=UPI003C737684